MKRDYSKWSSVALISAIYTLAGVAGWLLFKSLSAHFEIYSQKVIKVLNSIPQKARSFGTLIVDILGFKRGYYSVEKDSRVEGKSSYTISKLLKLSLDIVIVNTNKPFRLSVGFGFIISALLFAPAFYQLFVKWFGLITVQGCATTIFYILFVCGILLFVMGILELYKGISDQVKEALSLLSKTN